MPRRETNAEFGPLEISKILSTVQLEVSLVRFSERILQLAPSPRVAAFLARKGLLNLATMQIEGVRPLADRKPYEQKAQDALSVPPEVITTPCDPWPRPYYLEDGLRKVHPYHFTYNTYCKERWRGRELLEIFADEFRDRPKEYYVLLSHDGSETNANKSKKDAIERGNVVINGKPVPSVREIVKNGDIISHTLHRHEPPVTAQPIGIVHEDNDMIIINKPAGVPVHPAGRYMYNSIIEIMRAERGHAWNPLPCNRLDRLTSGVMFVGKNPTAAERISVQIQDRTVKKEYVARVIGEFPEGDIICEQPVMQISPKLGLNRARASGKSARTVFKRLSYYPPTPSSNGQGEEQEDTRIDDKKIRDSGMEWKSKKGHSIVRCLPVTGRTHQLRVHLQFLGHPISNDPIYCNQRVFGPSLAAGDDVSDHDLDIISRLSEMGKTESAEAMAYHDELIHEYNKKKAEKMTGQFCEVCDTPLYSDPGAHELGIYLHAKRYACEAGQWGYETPLPEWALPPPGVTGFTDIIKGTDPIAVVETLGILNMDRHGPNGNSAEPDALIAPSRPLLSMVG